MKSSSSKNLQGNLKIRLPDDYPWKVLHSLIEDHSYCLSDDDCSLARHITRSRDYTALLNLSEAWRDSSPPLGISATINFRAKYQITSLIKKYRFPSGNKARRLAAIEKFKAAEETCRDFNRFGYRDLVSLKEPEHLNAFTYALSFLKRLLGTTLPSPEVLTLWSRHGPGANLDTKDGQTSMYHKYSEWPYSCTSDAFSHARFAIASDERWLGALENDYRDRFLIPKHVILNQDMFWENVLKCVDGNRIAFVPKNSQTDRSIAIEPSMNLYLQLGVDGFIRRRLKRWGVDLDDQTKNQVLAREGSRDWRTSNSFVTLDLAAASDTVSLKLCEIMLPSVWYQYLLDLRSPLGNLDDESIQYEKISSMGNGYTFALESAIFAALAYGAARATSGSFDKNEVAIYGDDIIVRNNVSGLMIKMLNLCGFTINPDKSFIEGPFRESCGADWFDGTSVRPVFLTAKPSTVIELWCDYNRLQRLLDLRGLVWESQTCQTISRWIPDIFSGFVGPYSDTDFDSYRHVPLPTGKYRNGLWVFNRLTLHAKRLNVGVNFHFRKLMNPLRQVADESFNPWSSKSWGGGRLSAVGNAFAITDAKSVTVCVTPTPTSIWSGQYNLPLSG
jgi:hypothetical protein